MSDKKIKVAMVTNHLGITGVATVIINYCKALDKRKYDLTILAGQPLAEKYKQECDESGIHLIVLPSRHDEPIKHYIGIWKTLKAGHYDIVHDHGNSSMMAIELTIARFAGIKNRIAHCHTKGNKEKWNYKILMHTFKHSYTEGFACSKQAGDWIFGQDNFQVLINGFNVKDYIYSDNERKEIRKALNLEGCFVIGHAGRFNNTKNQAFLLEIFKEFVKVKSNAILLLVGTGPDFEKIKELVSIHPNKDKIILYGESSDMSGLYSAMDIFVFPSKYEGLGLVAVEAQISGLPCVVSDVVPKEIVVGNNVTFISLKESASSWANTILNLSTSTEKRKDFYNSNQSLILRYDMNGCGRILDDCYQQIIGK